MPLVAGSVSAGSSASLRLLDLLGERHGALREVGRIDLVDDRPCPRERLGEAGGLEARCEVGPEEDVARHHRDLRGLALRLLSIGRRGRDPGERREAGERRERDRPRAVERDPAPRYRIQRNLLSCLTVRYPRMINGGS
jgi:hypothetical protein